MVPYGLDPQLRPRAYTLAALGSKPPFLAPNPLEAARAAWDQKEAPGAASLYWYPPPQ